MGAIRSKKLNKTPGVSTGKSSFSGKQSEWSKMPKTKTEAPAKKK